MNRLSVVFLGADDVKEKLKNIVSNIYRAIKIDQIFNDNNNNAHTALHIDNKDVGAGRKLLGKGAYLKSGLKFDGCNKKVIQCVIVISHKLNEKDALFSYQSR